MYACLYISCKYKTIYYKYKVQNYKVMREFKVSIPMFAFPGSHVGVHWME